MKFRSVAVVAPKILRSRFYQQRFFAAEATTTTAPSSSSTPKNRLSLFYDVITPQEEEKVLAYLTPLLAKRRYEGAHWDSVITRYKEIELHPPFDSQATNAYEEVENILNKVRNNIREQCQEPDLKFLSTHCIDLASDGHIGKSYPDCVLQLLSATVCYAAVSTYQNLLNSVGDIFTDSIFGLSS